MLKYRSRKQFKYIELFIQNIDCEVQSKYTDEIQNRCPDKKVEIDFNIT